jgi:hypothetical protein
MTTQGVFAGLFIWLLFETRKEARRREDRLMQHLEKTAEMQREINNNIHSLKNELKKRGDL